MVAEEQARQGQDALAWRNKLLQHFRISITCRFGGNALTFFIYSLGTEMAEHWLNIGTRWYQYHAIATPGHHWQVAYGTQRHVPQST